MTTRRTLDLSTNTHRGSFVGSTFVDDCICLGEIHARGFLRRVRESVGSASTDPSISILSEQCERASRGGDKCSIVGDDLGLELNHAASFMHDLTVGGKPTLSGRFQEA
jgi:hypothetical protein